jgi:hypothetical protein
MKTALNALNFFGAANSRKIFNKSIFDSGKKYFDPTC